MNQQLGFEYPDYEDEEFEPEMCAECLGCGMVVTCFDDMCVALGYCIHGDGEEICPECGGYGEV